MHDAKSVLAAFDGNITHAAEATGISRQTWHAWKRNGFADPMPEKLELWLLRRKQPRRKGRK